MGMIAMIATLAVAAGLTAATPASAETRSVTAPSTLATPLAQPGMPTASAEQYRSRYRYRYRAGWRQYRYRPRYYANRGWRGRGVTCRTSWRYGRPRRVCWRR